jgi:hypothetical protein
MATERISPRPIIGAGSKELRKFIDGKDGAFPSRVSGRHFQNIFRRDTRDDDDVGSTFGGEAIGLMLSDELI